MSPNKPNHSQSSNPAYTQAELKHTETKPPVNGRRPSEPDELSSARSRLKRADTKPVHTSSVTVQVKGSPQPQKSYKPVEISVALPAQATIHTQGAQLQNSAHQVSRFEPAVTSQATHSPQRSAEAAVVTSVTPGSKAAAVALLSSKLQAVQAKVSDHSCQTVC